MRSVCSWILFLLDVAIADKLRDICSTAQIQRQSLVDLDGVDFQYPTLAVSPLPAALLHEVAQRVGLEDESELRFGIHCDAAVHDGAMEIGH